MKEGNKIENDIWDLLKNPKRTDEILNSYSKNELKMLKKSLLDIKVQAIKSKPDFDKIWGEIQASIPEKENKRKYLYKPLKYAISIVGLFLLTFTSYYILDNNNPIKESSLATNIPVIKTEHDIAELTLSNGKKINLSKINKGVLIKDADVSIINSSNNSLTYKKVLSYAKELEFNTIKVPKGGEYSITLSDGTVVRLNSQSSLKYPIHFIKNNRKVFLKGEAFFQVAENKNKPFVVEVDNMNVEVLGTVFNINSYPENYDIKTTLVKGSVKVFNKNNIRSSVIIKPSEQVVFSPKGIKKRTVNIKEYVSWVRGKFYFKDMSLENVMIQIERWYNVNAVFIDHDVKKFPFTGVINRSSSLEETMRIIRKISKAKIKINENKVIIGR